MANAIYPKAKENLLSGKINLVADTVKLILVDGADYTYSAAHSTLADVLVGARVATSPALTGKSVTNGVFDAADMSIPNVSGDPFEIGILYVDSGAEATSYLISYMDDQAALIVNGGAVNVVWGDTASKILQL